MGHPRNPPATKFRVEPREVRELQGDGASRSTEESSQLNDFRVRLVDLPEWDLAVQVERNNVIVARPVDPRRHRESIEISVFPARLSSSHADERPNARHAARLLRLGPYLLRQMRLPTRIRRSKQVWTELASVPSDYATRRNPGEVLRLLRAHPSARLRATGRGREAQALREPARIRFRKRPGTLSKWRTLPVTNSRP